MKAFISADLEGMPFVVIPGHLKLKGSLYDEARRVATKVVLMVADELHKNGFNEVVVADSHGPMVNLMVDDLPEYLEVVRGFPRPVCMVSGIEGCDAACFVGYHAKAGTQRSTLAHTYSGANIQKVQVNGVEASEFLLNAYVAGELGVPVIMVAGEAKLIEDDVRKIASWIETVILKRSMSSSAGKSPSILRLEKELRTSVGRAVSNFKQNKTALLTTKTPVRVGVTFKATHQADASELLPGVTRVDGLSVEYLADTMLNAYKIFELLILAATGSSAILATMK
ncbi:MAG: M55 family metallopeptidase [Candidatus Bathyarchaeota archaeon]|nr:M55 family metallopeptidase [Candidatus Bathyarchaeota archaeon]